MFRRKLLKNCLKLSCTLHQTRNTWILKHVHPPTPTEPGFYQRPPNELQSLQKYELVGIDYRHDHVCTIKVILTQDIEGIGSELDVVEVDRNLARTDLLITGKAVYASPFNLRKFAEMREERAEELANRLRVPYQISLTMKRLQAMIILVRMNISKKWTIGKVHLRSGLRQMGIDAADDTIFLSPELITGPDMNVEAKLVRFYLLINNQFVIPMVYRISHITSTHKGEILLPEHEKQPTEIQLNKFGIQMEPLYLQKVANIVQEKGNVYSFMQSLIKKTN